MSLIPFSPWHLLRIQPSLQPQQAGFKGLESKAYADSLRSGGPCWTLADDWARPVACGGLFTQWDGRAIAWAFLTSHVPMLEATRRAREVLDMAGVRRVECWVDVDFKAGHRWAKLLGFEREGLMRSFCPDGRDNVLYARIT